MQDPRSYLVNHPAKYNYYWRQIRRAAKRHKIAIDLPPPYKTSETFEPRDLPRVDLATVLESP